MSHVVVGRLSRFMVVAGACLCALMVCATTGAMANRAGADHPIKLKHVKPGLIACLAGKWVSDGVDYPGYSATGGDGATLQVTSRKSGVAQLAAKLSYANMNQVKVTKDEIMVALRFRGSLSFVVIPTFSKNSPTYDGAILVSRDYDVHLSTSINGGAFMPTDSGGASSPDVPNDFSCSKTTLTVSAAGDPVVFGFHRVANFASHRTAPQERRATRTEIARRAGSGVNLGALEKDPCKLVTRAQAAQATGVPTGPDHVVNNLGPTPVCQIAIKVPEAGPQDDAVEIQDLAYNAVPPESVLGAHYKKIRIDGHPGFCGQPHPPEPPFPANSILLLGINADYSLEVNGENTDGRSGCAVAETLARDASPKL